MTLALQSLSFSRTHLGLLLLALYGTVSPASPARAEDPQPAAAFSAECLKQAQDRLSELRVQMHDVKAPKGLPAVDAALAAALKVRGVYRGWWVTDSLISPPSSYALVELPGEAAGPAVAGEAAVQASACPLTQTYLVYHQGGFVPQPPRYFGPLQAATMR